MHSYENLMKNQILLKVIYMPMIQEYYSFMHRFKKIPKISLKLFLLKNLHYLVTYWNFPGQTIQNDFFDTFSLNIGYNFHTYVC